MTFLCDAGHCEKDGLYYKDSNSFVICIHSTAFVQPCAPGTKNSPHKHFEFGQHYGKADFCNINLVDHGFSATYNQKHPVHPKVQ